MAMTRWSIHIVTHMKVAECLERIERIIIDVTDMDILAQYKFELTDAGKVIGALAVFLGSELIPN